MEAVVFAARSRLELATALRAANAGADAATELAQEALATAERLNLPWLTKECLATQSTDARPDKATSATLRRTGHYWLVGVCDDVVPVRGGKGLVLLARLLAAPGVEVHVLDLAGPEKVAAAGLPHLDDQARRAYRLRVEDLREQIEEAERHSDLATALRAREELAALTDHLAGAVGLGGRGRLAGAAAEQARVNVTKLIRGAIRRIAEVSPALGRHLAATVRTGTFCAYDPSRGERPYVWTIAAK